MKIRIKKRNLILGIFVLVFCVGIIWTFLIYKANRTIEQLRSDDWQVREKTTKNLGKLGKPAVGPLITALRDDDGDIRWRTAKALGDIGDSRAIEPLVQALKDEDSRVRYRAVEALDKIGGSQVIEPLINNVLTDENIYVQERTLEALLKIGEPAVELLIIVLKNEDDKHLRMKAVEILGEIYRMTGESRIWEAIVDTMLNNKDWYVRNKAVEVLDKIHWVPASEEERIKYLIAKQDWDACVKIGEPAINPLIDTLEVLNEDIRQKALSTLIEMTGEDSGTDFYRWRMWWEQRKERKKSKFIYY